jgi:hypothetical protein
MNHSKNRIFAAAVLLLGAWLPVHAEPMYVIDKVLINVYAEPNQEAAKVTTLETGDTVEAIDALEPYIQVRLADGREGWVRQNYLSKQAPAIVRLKELQSEAQPTAPPGPAPQVVQELADLKKQNGALRAEVARLHQQAAHKPIAAPTPVPAAKAAPVNQQVLVQTAPTRFAATMWIWIVAIVAGAGLGFLFGYQTLALRIRRKYGNIKIY